MSYILKEANGYAGKLLRVFLDEENTKEENLNFIIEMDGGINSDTILQSIKQGAEWFVAGNAVFGEKNRIGENFINISNGKN